MVQLMDHYARFRGVFVDSGPRFGPLCTLLFILVGERGVPAEGPGENRCLDTKGILWRSHPFRGRTWRKKARYLAAKGVKHRRRSFRGFAALGVKPKIARINKH